MPNPHRREITLTLAGKKRLMRPTLEACVGLEDELEHGLMDIMATMRERAKITGGLTALKIREVAAVLRWGVWGAEGGPKPLDAEPMLEAVWAERDAGRLPEVMGYALAFIMASLNVDDPERSAEDGGGKK